MNKHQSMQPKGGRGTGGWSRKAPKNDGNLYTSSSKVRKRDFLGNHRGGAKPSVCFITTACARSRGLADDCYELELLRMFRENYVAARPDGEEVLTEYRVKAPLLVAAIDALEPLVARATWDYIYEDGVAPACCLILSGHWDAAFDLYREVCRVLEGHFLDAGDEDDDAGMPVGAATITRRASSGPRRGLTDGLPDDPNNARTAERSVS